MKKFKTGERVSLLGYGKEVHAYFIDYYTPKVSCYVELITPDLSTCDISGIKDQCLKVGYTTPKATGKYWVLNIDKIEAIGNIIESPLILGKFNIGDVVVSLTDMEDWRYIGDIFKVLENSCALGLYYKKDTNSISTSEWRIATPEEKQAYEKGITNIKNIPKEEVVLPEYVKCVKSDMKTSFTEGRIYHNFIDNDGKKRFIGILNGSLWTFEPSTKEAYDEQFLPKEPNLLSEAKRRYPVGTRYKCAAGGHHVYIVEKQSFTLYTPTTVYGEDRKGCLFKNGKWAEIIPVEEPKVDNLLEQLQKMYPIGTRYYGVNPDGGRTPYIQTVERKITCVYEDGDNVGYEGGVGYVYANFTYAIIAKDEPSHKGADYDADKILQKLRTSKESHDDKVIAVTLAQSIVPNENTYHQQTIIIERPSNDVKLVTIF